MLWEIVGDELGGLAYRAHSISSLLISNCDQLIETSMYHLLYTVCCIEARALRLGCWERIILRIPDLFEHSHDPQSPKSNYSGPLGFSSRKYRLVIQISHPDSRYPKFQISRPQIPGQQISDTQITPRAPSEIDNTGLRLMLSLIHI